MIVARKEDSYHKAQLLMLLTEIIDDTALKGTMHFKGGTCASMLGYLDRFSIDLDFDLAENSDLKDLRNRFHKIFSGLNFTVSYENKRNIEFIVKYEAAKGSRNSIKVSALPNPYQSNVYKTAYLPEIDRFASCQTIETMFAHKLVAPIDRFRKYKTVAGRDIYDIHHFFMMGYRYSPEIIEERERLKVKDFLKKLAGFIEKQVTETTINEDLNTLLPPDNFQKIRKILKTQTLAYLKEEY